MTTPIDRESVERPWASPMLSSLLEQMANQPSALDSYVIASGASMAITEIRALRAALDAAEGENKRLRQLIPRPDQTEDELVWRDHMRGVPLAALAKEFGVTRERMRHRLKKIAERKLHLTENPDG